MAQDQTAKAQPEASIQSEQPVEATKPAAEPLRFAEKVEQLEKAVAEAQEKATQNWDKALRAVAELENVKRRSERDIESAHKFALERFAQALLPIMDSLEKTLEVKTELTEVQKLYQGVEMTLKMFSDAVAKFGLEMLNPVGQAFDPHLHEAMSMIEDPKVAPNVIITVYQKGWRLNGRVIRPARVVVSK